MFSIKKRSLILAVILLLVPGVQVVLAQANPHILPPNSRLQEKTLSEWLGNQCCRYITPQLLKIHYLVARSTNVFMNWW